MTDHFIVTWLLRWNVELLSIVMCTFSARSVSGDKLFPGFKIFPKSTNHVQALL